MPNCIRATRSTDWATRASGVCWRKCAYGHLWRCGGEEYFEPIICPTAADVGRSFLPNGISSRFGRTDWSWITSQLHSFWKSSTTNCFHLWTFAAELSCSTRISTLDLQKIIPSITCSCFLGGISPLLRNPESSSEQSPSQSDPRLRSSSAKLNLNQYPLPILLIQSSDAQSWRCCPYSQWFGRNFQVGVQSSNTRTYCTIAYTNWTCQDLVSIIFLSMAYSNSQCTRELSSLQFFNVLIIITHFSSSQQFDISHFHLNNHLHLQQSPRMQISLSWAQISSRQIHPWFALHV